MTTAEIAYLLAYDDTNSFYTACRTWTRSTPDTVRTVDSAALTAVSGPLMALQSLTADISATR